MTSGDITAKCFDRLSGVDGLKPICGLTLEIVVASGGSCKTETIDENFQLIDMYLEAPAIVTGVANKFTLSVYTTRGNVIYETADIDATSATSTPIHIERGLVGTTSFLIDCDGNVNADETFMVELVGR